MKAIIWVVDENAEASKAGWFSLQDGKVVMQVVPGKERAMRYVQKQPVLTNSGEEISMETDPEKWIQALQFNYVGHRMNVEYEA